VKSIRFSLCAFFKWFTNVIQTTIIITKTIINGITANSARRSALNNPRITPKTLWKTEYPKVIFVHFIKSGVTLYNLKKNIINITNPIIDKTRLIIFTIGLENNAGVINVLMLINFNTEFINPNTIPIAARIRIIHE